LECQAHFLLLGNSIKFVFLCKILSMHTFESDWSYVACNFASLEWKIQRKRYIIYMYMHVVEINYFHFRNICVRAPQLINLESELLRSKFTVIY
jgi:hypothetical protein